MSDALTGGKFTAVKYPLIAHSSLLFDKAAAAYRAVYPLLPYIASFSHRYTTATQYIASLPRKGTLSMRKNGAQLPKNESFINSFGPKLRKNGAQLRKNETPLHNDETQLHSSNALLAGNDPFPAGNELFPAENDPFPTGNELEPAGNGLFPAGNDLFLRRNEVSLARRGLDLSKNVSRKVRRK